MQGPSDQFRGDVARMIDALEEAPDPEASLEEMLSMILGQVAEDQPAQLQTDDDVYPELAAIETWASLASHAVQALYAPSSPSKLAQWKERRGEDKLAGWCQGAAEKLRRIVEKLREGLTTVAQRLHGFSFSVGVNFPWGVAISIAWAP